MSEKSTTPDVVELTRQAFEAGRRHDLDGATRFYAPDAVWDLSDGGFGTFEGVAAIRGFLEDWWGTWGEHVAELQEIVDLGHGVMFVAVWDYARPAGSDGHVEQRMGWVLLWVRGMVERVTVYRDVVHARAAAERLAESRA
jgi:ketosteroid isomerase-like protein